MAYIVKNDKIVLLLFVEMNICSRGTKLVLYFFMSFIDYSLPISLRMLSIVIIIWSRMDIKYLTMLFVELDKQSSSFIQ